LGAVASTVVALSASIALAQNTATWQGTSNNLWLNAQNWDTRVVPDADTDVYIDQGPTCVIDGAGECHSLHLGTNQGQSGSLTVLPGGLLEIGDEDPPTGDVNLHVGENGTGTITLQGDPAGTENGGWIICWGRVYVARYAGSIGTINVSGNAALIAGTDMFVGGDADFVSGTWVKTPGGTGTLTISSDPGGSGTVMVSDALYVRENFHGTLVICKPDEPPHTSVSAAEGNLIVESLDGVAGSKIYIEDPPGNHALTVIATGNNPPPPAPPHLDPLDDAGNFQGHISGPGGGLKSQMQFKCIVFPGNAWLLATLSGDAHC
jgi:hypothetical protein